MLGTDHLDSLLPDLLAACTNRNPFVREGHITLFRCVRRVALCVCGLGVHLDAVAAAISFVWPTGEPQPT